VSLDYPREALSFFPERLSNHYQDVRRTFSVICTKFDARTLSYPWRGFDARPATQLCKQASAKRNLNKDTPNMKKNC
jgi:hypothetical protein